MNVVTNTGPLIMLAKIEQLVLLPQLFSSISTPPAVYRELMAKGGAEAQRLEVAFANFIAISNKPKADSVVKISTAHLDAGEHEAIALAYERQHPIIIDERLGRQAARKLGLTVTGSVGVLIEAKRKGLITEVVPLLFSARGHGYWLSDELITIAAKMVDETFLGE